MQPTDKSLAVGLELTLVGLIAYIPGRLLYQLMAGTGSHIAQRTKMAARLVRELSTEPLEIHVGVHVGIPIGMHVYCGSHQWRS